MELPEEEWEEIVYFQDYVKSPRVQQEHHQFRDVFAKGRMPDRKGDDQNLRFFRNTLKCRPDGMFLDEIHRYARATVADAQPGSRRHWAPAM